MKIEELMVGEKKEKLFSAVTKKRKKRLRLRHLNLPLFCTYEQKHHFFSSSTKTPQPSICHPNKRRGLSSLFVETAGVPHGSKRSTTTSPSSPVPPASQNAEVLPRTWRCKRPFTLVSILA